jgi:Domain of unknown function (DUF4159)
MRTILLGITVLSTVLVVVAPARPVEPKKDQPVEQVQNSIDAGVKYLRGVGAERGNWEADVSRPGGWSCLALLALLNSGVPANDKLIQRGLEYLRTVPPSQTYVVALQTMVYAQAGQAVDRERIQKNVNWLLEARTKQGWTYTKINGNVADNSNTQYALLGLHEALLAGANVDANVLKELRDFYVGSQVRGGWGYHARNEPTMTMTTAGVCGLLITGMDLAIGKQQLRDDGSAANCGVYEENKPVANGLQWIGQRFPGRIDNESIAGFGTPFYCLYGIERTGRLSGQRYFGGHDWYRLGCEWLVKIQKADGSWEGQGLHRQLDHWPVVATSFSLLFLSKGRTPVLVTKMAHSEGDAWNNKRSDARNLVEFASRELFKKQPMAWQVFDIRTKAAEDVEAQRALAAELLPSPIVYLNGHHLRLSDKEKSVLAEYIRNGGFLFAEACCGDRELFDRDFQALMEDLFKRDDGKPALVKVPEDHPVWYASGKFVIDPNWRKDFPLYGIQQGCKWVVMYSPRPLAGYWEQNQFTQGRGKLGFELGANIIAYATGMEPPRPRLTQVAVVSDDVKAPKVRRGFLEVGQLAHGGDWKPAPRAMRYLMEDLRKSGLDVILSTAQVPLSGEVGLENSVAAPVRQVLDVNFFYMHGRLEFAADKDVMQKLRFKLANGGTLFADACCGSHAFDDSFRKFMAQMWADKKLKLETIPLRDEIYSKALNGVDIDKVHCRRAGPNGKVMPEYQVVPPSLEGIKYNGRWVVIYSKYDIGCALENHAATDCLGHDRASAMLLARAAVLYALKR